MADTCFQWIQCLARPRWLPRRDWKGKTVAGFFNNQNRRRGGLSFATVPVAQSAPGCTSPGADFFIDQTSGHDPAEYAPAPVPPPAGAVFASSCWTPPVQTVADSTGHASIFETQVVTAGHVSSQAPVYWALGSRAGSPGGPGSRGGCGDCPPAIKDDAAVIGRFDPCPAHWDDTRPDQEPNNAASNAK